MARIGKRYHGPDPLPSTIWRMALRPLAWGVLALLFFSLLSIIIIGVFK